MSRPTIGTPSPTQQTLDSYDAVPYPNMTHHATNPLRTAALARLLGMEPTPPDHCRVLDIGCATGANILALAAAFPNSTYVGVDLSGVQIAQGQRMAQALGLQNIALHALDLTRIDEEFGQFDYIIAHGLYSWVPAAVRDSLLRTCRARLAPNGVAYISYNCFPGWHSFQAYRQMLLYRTAHLTEPRARIHAVKQYLEFLRTAWPADRNYHGAFLHGLTEQLNRDADVLGAERDAYIYHEYLEAVNEPCYVHEFLAHAEAHGLQYLCDADLHLDFPNGFEPGIAEQIDAMATNLAEYQQHMDNVRMRAFRRTLLCHGDQPIVRNLRVERLRGLYVGAALRAPADAPPLHSTENAAFDAADGITFTTNHPLTKAALTLTRARYPAIFRLEQLAQAAALLLRETGPAADDAVTAQDVGVLGASLLRMVTAYSTMLETWALPAQWATQPPARPRLSRWARYELQTSPFVTNLRHERVRLDPIEAALARLLDGTRDAAALAVALEPAIREGAVALSPPGEPPLPPDAGINLLPTAIDERLRLLTIYALLEPD